MYLCGLAGGYLMLILHGLYPPGAAGPKDFVQGDLLTVKVQRLASVKTQLPYSYYSLPYCIPKKDLMVNLGEFLSSAVVVISPYEFKMREPQMCIVFFFLLNAKDAKELKERIDDKYRVKMILDNVPPLDMPYNRSYTDSSEHQHVLVGVKVQYDGGKPEHKYFVNNHLTSTIKYHKDVETDAARTVGFEVKQFSVMHEYECKDDKIRLTNCTVTGNDSPLEVEDENGIIFTYDVECQESEINWASRLDTYHYMLDSENHWLSILISLFAVILPLVMVADIMPCDVSEYDE